MTLSGSDKAIPSITLAAGPQSITFIATGTSLVLTVTNNGAGSNGCTFTLYKYTPQTIITAVNSGSQIIISQPATSSNVAVAIVVAPHGVGDGSTTFNIPDARGRMIMGAGQGNTGEGEWTGTTQVPGVAGGAETHTQAADEVGPATITVTDPGHVHPASSGNFLVSGGGSSIAAGTYAFQQATNTGSSMTGISGVVGNPVPTPMNITSPYTVRKILIRY
jgi:microcystin-dependent protein